MGGTAVAAWFAQAAVEVAHQAGQQGGLAEAPGEQQHQGAAVEEGLDQAEHGDDGGFAGLAGAVEQEARVVAFQDLRLPGVGLHAEQAHQVDGGGTRVG
ncbi:MAG TPA: hypothetical protein VG013_00750 [Gemmataceae bacterium]|nr:hypothetical protein [Gemmataceae bacterium]